MEFTALIGFQAVLLVMFVFLFTRLERRVERLEDSMKGGFADLRTEMTQLRRDLAEEFRAQRAEVAQQITAISNAIIASRGT